MNFSIAGFTALVLSLLYQALREGVIGYQSDIRAAFDRIMSYLQTKYLELELNAVWEQPGQEAIRTVLLNQFEHTGINQDEELLRLVFGVTTELRWNVISDTEIYLLRYLPKMVEEPMQVLAAYGLDELLTDEDDRGLWATAVVEAWGFPRDLQVDIFEYYFQTATPLPDSDQYRKLEWRLTEVAGRISAKPWTEADKVAEMVQRLNEPCLEPALSRICVSRPSANRNEAWVAVDSIGLGGLIGGGHWDDWVRRPNGSWVPDKRGGGYIC